MSNGNRNSAARRPRPRPPRARYANHRNLRKVSAVSPRVTRQQRPTFRARLRAEEEVGERVRARAAALGDKRRYV